ncbi:hypothetical protein BC826DRAFT_1056157, partial [Russula brevipes]
MNKSRALSVGWPIFCFALFLFFIRTVCSYGPTEIQNTVNRSQQTLSSFGNPLSCSSYSGPLMGPMRGRGRKFISTR